MSMAQTAPPPKRRPASAKPRLKRAEREQQVLDRAEKIFTKQGFDGTSVEDIAAACGITKPVIYQLFGSKQGLFDAVLERASAALSQMMLHVLAVADHQDKLHDSLRSMMTYVYQHGPLLQHSPHRAMGPDTPLRRQLVESVITMMASTRPAHLPEEEARWRVAPYAHALLGAAEGGATFWASERDFTVADAETASSNVLEAVLKIVKSVLEAD